jgi:hypothetical protein
MATTYIPLYTTTLASTTSTVAFSSIPAGYTDLVLVCNAIAATNASMTIQFNGDTANNYSYIVLDGSGTTVSSNRQNNVSAIQLASWSIGMGSTTIPSPVIANIQNYSNATTFKTVLTRSSVVNASAAMGVDAFAGLWRNTAAITSLTINGNTFAIGSTFSLYGIAAASVGAKATGGDFIGNDGSYFYHVFNSSGTFTPLQSLSTDVLVIAGGGGGGGAMNGCIGGGGGAGGYQYFTGQSVTATGYTVTVGAGGTGGGVAPDSGTNGSNSVFGALAASVGGGGGGGGSGSGSGLSGNNGGSGGGAGFSSTTTTVGGTGTAGQGNNGGNEGSGGGGSGGGGAGGAGTNPFGGAGLANSIAGSSITYAIGGQGNGAAGIGVTPSSPFANRGIGGDAGWNSVGGNGGSGLVIVRYPI